MDLQIFGKIIDGPTIREGVSSKGNEWRCASYVIETEDRYPKRMAFDVFSNANIDKFAIKQGEYVTVFFDIDAREYKNRWFNTIRAWRVERPGEQQPQQDMVPPYEQQQPMQAQQPQQQQVNDALPF